ncbi:MAG TPA: ABC transporter permease [Candidatus Binatia bacterium]|jgi:ABC-type dipeptide/oligopeptide/nickel transport system permease component
MLAYCIRRSLWALPTMFAVLVFIFLVMRVLPGDPAYAILGDEAPPEALEQFRRNWGLDRPLPQQFGNYMSGLLTGDLGLSMANRQPILPQLLRAMPYTLDLTIAGSAIGLLFGIPLGVFTARHRNSSVDYVGRIISLAGLSVPSFYLGILLIFFLSFKYQWFPVIGGGDLSDPWSRLYHLVLPALSVGLSQTAYITRVTRSSFLEVINADFVQTARAKGVGERLVMFKHALRNALVPVVSVAGIYVGILIGSSILVTIVFNRPGLGKLMVGAISTHDYTMLQSIMAFYAGIIVIVNLLTDLAYGLVDPRIRYS